MFIVVNFTLKHRRREQTIVEQYTVTPYEKETNEEAEQRLVNYVIKLNEGTDWKYLTHHKKD